MNTKTTSKITRGSKSSSELVSENAKLKAEIE